MSSVSYRSWARIHLSDSKVSVLKLHIYINMLQAIELTIEYNVKDIGHVYDIYFLFFIKSINKQDWDGLVLKKMEKQYILGTLKHFSKAFTLNKSMIIINIFNTLK